MGVYFCNFYYGTYDSCSTNLAEFFFKKIIKRIQQPEFKYFRISTIFFKYAESTRKFKVIFCFELGSII
jgi:hypothetical protein